MSATVAIVAVALLIVAAISACVTFYTFRAGYAWGPYWQSPLLTLSQVGPARRASVALGILGLIAYLVAVWHGPAYLPNIVLGVFWVLAGGINIREPRMPNTRLNFRWAGVGFILLGLTSLTLGVARAASHHRLSPLFLVIIVPLFAAAVVAFVMSYVRALPAGRC